VSVASAANDHRLGAAEAPPAIVSIFLGDELQAILESIINGTDYHGTDAGKMKLGVHVLPDFPKDNTDRNRTSPFAFTGNKFEFRMLGSTASVADPNIVLNTIVAEALCSYADRLEGVENLTEAVHELVRKTMNDHMRIVFNGNGYSDEWKAEAERRGLLNLASTVDALPQMMEQKNIDVFVKHMVYNESEIRSRYEVLLENYSKAVNIEALTAIDMVRKKYLPAISAYVSDLSDTVIAKKGVSNSIPCTAEVTLIAKLSTYTDAMFKHCDELEVATKEAAKLSGLEQARYFCDVVLPLMETLRSDVDSAETLTAEDYWPVSTYGELLFMV
ncbi:MAG: glutamine synthetase type III, partial [Clostridia bacterium]|nr:glutamine synthetase type III [Clostridia bacterium]